MKTPEFDENASVTNSFAWFGYTCMLVAVSVVTALVTNKITDKIFGNKD